MFKFKKIIYIFLISNCLLSYGSNKKITIFVHGILFPVMSQFVHTYDCPIGLTSADKLDNKFIHSKIGYILNSQSPSSFPLENIYLFGWSGKLSFEEREKAAAELFKYLENFKNDSITIIGHSHGCNVALNLAKLAKSNEFKIDQLILLAGPVQDETKNLINSVCFKKVYSFFSSSDYIQVLDPQGIYPKKNKKPKKNKQFFSQRIYPTFPNLIQCKVKFQGKDPWHIDFILEKFLKFMPKMIDGLQYIRNSELDKIVPISININEENKLLFTVKRYDPKGYFFKRYHIIQTNDGFTVTDLF